MEGLFGRGWAVVSWAWAVKGLLGTAGRGLWGARGRV